MRIAVVGLGGVGGYFGGRLAQKYAGAGRHRVIFIARGAHLEAIRNRGLALKTQQGDFNVRPDLATDRPEEAGPIGLLLLAVKEYDLEATAAALAPLLLAETVVLPLLNGVDIAERLQTLLPRGDVLSGCIYISSFIESPGVVCQAGGACQLIFGPENGRIEAYRSLEALFREAGIRAELVSDIAVHVWSKYLFVSPMAGVTSLSAKPFGAVMADPGTRSLVRELMGEILALARARGIALPADSVEAAIAKADAFPFDTRSSMQLDYEKGRPTEVELFIGTAVRAGRVLGVSVPRHERLYADLKR